MNCSNSNGGCHHITGRCRCAPGYIGPNCGESCPSGKWGQNCREECQCQNLGDCDHRTGECLCFPGWHGPDCSLPCPKGYFGLNCAQQCSCLNGGMCRPHDGKCRCPPGWTGPKCQEVCSEGYYGDHCMQACMCQSDNYLCHPVNGCICKNGYTGETCSETMHVQERVALAPEPSHSTASVGGITAGIIIAIIVIVALVGVVIYLLRRNHRLKQDQLYVQYMANGGISTEWNHVGNPIYSYNSTSSSGGTSTLNNTNVGPGIKHIRNDIANAKNAEKAKVLEVDEGVDSQTEASGACGPSLYAVPNAKCRDADNHNPNLYNSIDDAKVSNKGHFYYEVPERNADTETDIDSEAYDHLQHNRPGSEMKPHYHRVNSTLSAKGRK